MPTLTLALSADLKQDMDALPELNWSQIARQAIAEKVKECKMFKVIVAKSKLTENDALALGRKVNESLHAHLKDGSVLQPSFRGCGGHDVACSCPPSSSGYGDTEQPEPGSGATTLRTEPRRTTTFLRAAASNQAMAEMTEEELRNMSPEELMEFQKKNCVFCQIAAGKVPAKKVFEDDTVIAVLDINPANLGHVLLLPKEHYAVLPQVPDEVVAHVFMAAKAISESILRAFKVRGTSVYVANGVAAGQKAPHVMVHIMPRMPDDGIKLAIPRKEKLAEMQKKLHQPLKAYVDNAFKIAEEKEAVKEKKKEKEEKKPTAKKAAVRKKRAERKETAKKRGVTLDDVTELFK